MSGVLMSSTQRTGQGAMARARMNALLALLVLGALCASAMLSLAHAQDVGRVERITGTVTATAPGGAPRTLAVGDAIRQTETISTENRSEAVLKFSDETAMTLRQSSQVFLNSIRYQQQADDNFVVGLIKGGFRLASGAIGRNNRTSVRFISPTATVGIRGTDFEMVLQETDQGDLRAGIYNTVHEGTTFLELASGPSQGQTLDVPVDKTGLALTNPRPGEAPLQLLDGRPAFLRGGGFDAMMLQQTRPQPPIIIRPMR
jgi:hypothetical protein